MLTRRSRSDQQTRAALSDTLLLLAASLQDSARSEDAVERLTGKLSSRGVGSAIFVQAADGQSLELSRSTLPFAPEVWGRPLRLPRLEAAALRNRPAVYGDLNEALAGAEERLLTEQVSGKMIAAPVRVPGSGFQTGWNAVLCLVSHDLQEADRTAVWGLALALGAAMRPTGAQTELPIPAESLPALSGDLPVFHDLTRRLSFSLSGDEVIRAGLDVLAPAIGVGAAASVMCHGAEDATTVYANADMSSGAAASTAAGALDAFIKLTGERHRGCARPPFDTVSLDMKAPAGKIERWLDAPFVVDGEVCGLLRIGSPDSGGFDSAAERMFFTVANQLSLALERVKSQRLAERAQLASLAESLTDGIVLVDAALRVTSLNDAAREQLGSLTGAGPAEGDVLVNATLADLASQALTTLTSTASKELTANDGASGVRYLVAMAAPLAGSPEGSAAVVITRDVTEERLMQERLLQSEKMVSVGQLVSGVAHELNNPLTGIMGFAQLLQARDLDEATQRDVATIYGEAERAAKIVQNLLSFARRKRAEKELADLNVLIERVLELRTYDLRVKNIELVLDLDPHLPSTMVDANQVQQVFFNVIVNAEQAMLSADGSGTLTVRSSAQDDTIRLVFQDDGPGMEPETLRRIFDPFFTTKDTGEGTGLGLTITYGIIDEHKGRIWAESQPGRGTTFVIELPIVSGPGALPALDDAEPEPSVTGHAILVVDDEASIQRLLGSILEMDGHQVDTARNGREALERIGQRRYDMVITDIKMPDMDGRSLYHRLAEIDPVLARRTVFITGDTVSPDTRDFLEGVDNPCLSKPFRVREVRETIAHMLSESARV